MSMADDGYGRQENDAPLSVVSLPSTRPDTEVQKKLENLNIWVSNFWTSHSLYLKSGRN